jgi:two-component system, chemotaxis family, protein-glutamate methylesterase/glutaminase
MANRDIVAIGTSAGGVEALLFLAKNLQSDLPASVLLTIHLPSHARSALDEVLSSAGKLPAQFAKDGDTLRKSRIYIAPPDRHLIVDGDRLSLGEGPRENNSRPAIDPMLRSAAVCCGSRAIGVVLTGTLGDGASGLWSIRQAGGLTVVQDPKDAAFAEMPLTALNRAKPDHVVRLKDMPGLLASLAHEPAGQAKPLPRSIQYEVEMARTGRGSMDEMDQFGRRSVLACPDCGGVMWEIDEGEFSRFRCHVGHTYTAELMSLALDESLRRALASAVRALEERAELARKLYDQAKSTGHRLLAENWAAKRDEFEREMNIVRGSIRRMDRLAAQVDVERRSAAE